MRSALVLLGLVACGDDGAALPDAMLVLPDGNFTCAGLPLATTAADPVLVRGLAIDKLEAGIAGVTAEVHDVAGDALLGTATSSDVGAFGIQIATGGVALRTYRKLSAAGFVTTYGYDPRPMTSDAPLIANLVLDAAMIDAYYDAAGLTRDPAKGTVWLDISDCAPVYLAGATVDAPSGTIRYLDAALAIDTTLTETTSGAVVILNADVGVADIAVHAGPLTYRSWPITVRADSLTQVDRFP